MFGLNQQQKKVKEVFSRLFQKNKYEKLLSEYISLSEKHPDDQRIWLKIAETYFKARDIDNAVLSYKRVAESFEKENFFLKAVAAYKNILKIKPTLVEINLKLAALYSKIGMTQDMVGQYRIAMNFFESRGDKDQLIETSRKLLEVNPTAANRRKLAEIYQNAGMMNEALEQYEILSREFRLNKQYDDLLRIYELMLPHKPKNHPLIRDICILYLRRQEPDAALRVMERHHVDTDPEFSTLYEKARLMREALRKPAR